MKPSTHRLVARLIGVPATIVMFASIALMITGYVGIRLREPVDKQRLDALGKLAKEDASQIPALVTERDRQRDASLERAKRADTQTNILIIAAVLFLIGAKWSTALQGRKPPDLSRIMTDRAIPAGGPQHRSRGKSLRLPVFDSGREPDAAQIDLSIVDNAIARHGRGTEAVIPILHTLQSSFRYLPDDALRYVCDHTRITPAQITGVSSFFKQFRRTPVGKRIIKVCHGTACHVAGARTVTDELRRVLDIKPGADTDPGMQFTIEEVACLGCCTLAPVMQIDDVTYGHLTTDGIHEALHDCLAAERNGAIRRRRPTSTATLESALAKACGSQGEIRIGLGSCCVAGGSGKVLEALEEAVQSTGIQATIKRVGCVGMCHQTPLVDVALHDKPSAFYAGVGPEDAKAIVRRHFRPVGITRRVADTASSWIENIVGDGRRQSITRRSIEVRDPPVAAFLGRQKHIATEHFGRLDPTNLDEYLQHDGFKALEHCVTELTPQAIIEEIHESGLRGRGGAGFPTGLKWARVRDATGDEKYVICNGDEGDPGAFMDRMLMESFPYRIIEGMAIAAYAVGATEGYFYIRAEYPLAVRRIRDALRKCEERGYLGESLFNTGVALRLSIMEGAGAFVCGEETALMASIEGNRGSPRLRPPFPADRGLWGKPTLVNNVETYATVPWIIRHGANALTALGTETSKGTKVFSLAGKVKRGGLIEVPMGVTVREIVFEIGGGIKEDRAFKAVQIGGPSGGCIPAALADTPVDYEALADVGAIMGSGGLVVLDETDCMVDIARYFLSFTQDQSCGKCTFCRIGTRRMLEILDKLCAGSGHAGDLETLEQLAHSVTGASLCGLGKTAPNPVLSTLRYFHDEYEAHLDGRCPAGKCKELISYRVTDRCIGCTLCAQDCPVEAIRFTPYERHEIDDEKCTRCDTCRAKCPEDAIEVV